MSEKPNFLTRLKYRRHARQSAKQMVDVERLRVAVCNEILGTIQGDVTTGDRWERCAVDDHESNFEKGFWRYYFYSEDNHG